jgi:hypothetical protein
MSDKNSGGGQAAASEQLRTLVAMLADVPRAERRELVERAMLIAGGSFTFADMPHVEIDQRGTWGEPSPATWGDPWDLAPK